MTNSSIDDAIVAATAETCMHWYLPSKDPMLLIGGRLKVKFCIHCGKEFRAHSFVVPKRFHKDGRPRHGR